MHGEGAGGSARRQVPGSRERQQCLGQSGGERGVGKWLDSRYVSQAQTSRVGCWIKCEGGRKREA